MSPRDRALWQAMQRRAALLAPEMGLSLLRAYATIRLLLAEAEVARAIETGNLDTLFRDILALTVLDAAFQPARERMRRAVAESVRYTARTLPVPPPPGRSLAVSFDVLNPRVVTAIRKLETRVIGELASDIRETIRTRVEQGLQAGENPRAIARDLRPLVGVPPSREVWMQNYRAALENAATTNKALGYELRDKRFDATVAKARQSGTSIPPAKIDAMVAAMRKKVISFSADVVSRTATLDALKLGQRLSWDAAIAQGSVDRVRLYRRWAGVMDTRERPSHVAMQGDVAQFDEPHRNGQMVPGEDEYNCRCIDVFYLVAA
jgi:hypothetical protein